MEDEAKNTFLAALRQPLRNMLIITQCVKGKTVDIVIEWALQLELKDEGEGLSMASLWQALPQDEEYRFRHAIQCTICLNSGYLRWSVTCGYIAPFAIHGHIRWISVTRNMRNITRPQPSLRSHRFESNTENGNGSKYTYMCTHCKQESTQNVNVENPKREKPREPTDSKLSLCQRIQ